MNMKKCNPYYLFCSVWICSALSGCVVSEERDLGVERTSAPLLGEEDVDVVPGEYIVVFDDEAWASSRGETMAQIQALGSEARVEHSFASVPAVLARLSDRALAEVRRNPDVRFVERNRLMYVKGVQANAPAGLDRIDQRSLPLDGLYDDHGFNGSGVHIYVIDTGIRATHVELAGRVGSGFTAINDGLGTTDCNGHGTHMASVAAGTTFGVAKGATVHPVRVLSCAGSGSTAGILSGIDFVQNDCPTQSGRCVVNMSIGGGASAALDSAVAGLMSASIPTAVSSGSTNPCGTSPAREPSVMTVGRVSASDVPSPVSACVDIYAPGTNIPGAGHQSDTATITLSGTSAATAHVSGVAAMRLQQNRFSSAPQVAADILRVATELAGSPPPLLLYNDFATCQNSCGGQAPGGCFCDDVCVTFGDCCGDHADICL